MFVNKAARRPSSRGSPRCSLLWEWEEGACASLAACSPSSPSRVSRAVGQLSASRPSSPGVHDVCHVWVSAGGPRRAGEPGAAEEPELSPLWNFPAIESASALDECVLITVGVGDTLELGVSVPSACRVETRRVDLGVFSVGKDGWRGGRCYWKLGGSLQPCQFFCFFFFSFFFPPKDLKPGTSGVETKAQLSSFINKANQISHASKAAGSTGKSFVFTLTPRSFPLLLFEAILVNRC